MITDLTADVHALGGEASFLSVIGEDAEAVHLRLCLLERGVSPEHLW